MIFIVFFLLILTMSGTQQLHAMHNPETGLPATIKKENSFLPQKLYHYFEEKDDQMFYKYFSLALHEQEIEVAKKFLDSVEKQNPPFFISVLENICKEFFLLDNQYNAISISLNLECAQHIMHKLIKTTNALDLITKLMFDLHSRNYLSSRSAVDNLISSLACSLLHKNYPQYRNYTPKNYYQNRNPLDYSHQFETVSYLNKFVRCSTAYYHHSWVDRYNSSEKTDNYCLLTSWKLNKYVNDDKYQSYQHGKQYNECTKLLWFLRCYKDLMHTFTDIFHARYEEKIKSALALKKEYGIYECEDLHPCPLPDEDKEFFIQNRVAGIMRIFKEFGSSNKQRLLTCIHMYEHFILEHAIHFQLLQEVKNKKLHDVQFRFS